MTEPVMRALVALGSDPAGQSIQEIPRPAPTGEEVLIAVRAAAVTPGELDWPEQWPTIPGHDVSGTVVGLGPDVDPSTGIRMGDDVFALIAFDQPGAAAEFTCVPATEIVAKPRSVDHVAAAAVPLGALTAWQALFEHADLQPGQHVLVHGAAGGVGSYAVELAARYGARVSATASARDLDTVRALGAQTAVDYTTGLEPSLGDGLPRVDVVLDTVGGVVTARSWPLLRRGGTLIAVAEELPAGQAAHHGVRAVYFVVEPNPGQLAEITRRVDDGHLHPAVGRVVDLTDAATALDPPPGTPRVSGRTVIRVPPRDAAPEETP